MLETTQRTFFLHAHHTLYTLSKAFWAPGGTCILADYDEAWDRTIKRDRSGSEF